MSEGGMDVFALALKITTEGMEGAHSALEGIEEQGTGVASVLGAIASVLGVVLLAFEAVKEVVDFLKESIDAYAEEEEMFVRLGVAVQNAGQNFTDAKPAIDELLESLADKSTYRVDQLGQALTRLIQLTGNVGGSMKMLGIVTDFAAGRNMDLESAAQLVGKAMNGNATMLNRMLGLHGDAAQALEVLTERYKGNAEALNDTMGGAEKDAQKAMHELMEEIGGVIAKEGGAEDATRTWSSVLNDATKWVHDHRAAIGELTHDLITIGTFIGGQLLDVLRGAIQMWSALHLAVLIAKTTFSDIGPAWNLVVGTIILANANLLNSIANIIPGLHSLLDGLIQKNREYATDLINNANVAFAKNRQELDAFTTSLDKHAEEQKAVKKEVEDTGNAHKDNTAALVKEGDALAKIAEMNRLTGPQFVQEQELYATLTKLVESHTLKLEDEVKVRETLAKMMKATPALAMGAGGTQNKGDISLGSTQAPGISSDTYMKQLDKAITQGLINSEKHDKDVLKQRAQAFWASAEGEWQKASDQIKDKIDRDVMMDFVNLGSNIATTITDTLSAAFAGGFKNAGQVAAQGLGSIFSQMGKHMLLASAPLKALSAAMHNPITGGWALAAAGLILMALGAAIGSIALGGGGGGGSGDSGVAGAGSATTTTAGTTITIQDKTAAMTGIKLPTTNSGAASGLQPQPNVGPFNIFGPNDGAAQRSIIEAVNIGISRGLKVG